MQVRPVVVPLPNFNQRIADGIAVGVENSSAKVCDFADRGSYRFVNDQQVIVGIQGQLVGIKRPLGLSRSANQLLGKSSASAERGNSQSHTAQEMTPGEC